MNNTMLRAIRSVTHRLGLELTTYADFDPPTRDTVQFVWPFTMTSASRIAAVCEAVRYVCRNKVEGDVVECGVWRGGSMMAAARTLMECGDTSRQLYLYDTFEGMPPPTSKDRTRDDSHSAAEVLEAERRDTNSLHWAISPSEEVSKNLAATNYPLDRVHLVKGKVEDTIPGVMPERIAILRLDTDWYESTRHELHHLYPRLTSGGVLIIDDYGYWRGAREAVDEYFRGQSHAPMLTRVDSTGRVVVKP